MKKSMHGHKSGPILKIGGGLSHSSIPRMGYSYRASDTSGDTRRDSYGGKGGQPSGGKSGKLGSGMRHRHKGVRGY